MKPGMRAILSSALTLLLFFTTAFVLADETTAVYATKPIANFDDPAAGANWIVQGSKFATKDFPQMTIVRSWPEALFGRNKDNKSLLSMGIHGRFDRKGYNFIEIIPAKKGSDGKLAPAGIPLPGRVKILDMWVWGANYNFTVDKGAKDFTVSAAVDDTYAGVGSFVLNQAPGSTPLAAQVFTPSPFQARSIQFALTSSYNSFDARIGLSEVQFYGSPVPEPSTMAGLLGMGAMGVALTWRRMRRAG